MQTNRLERNGRQVMKTIGGKGYEYQQIGKEGGWVMNMDIALFSCFCASSEQPKRKHNSLVPIEEGLIQKTRRQALINIGITNSAKGKQRKVAIFESGWFTV